MSNKISHTHCVIAGWLASSMAKSSSFKPIFNMLEILLHCHYAHYHTMPQV